jgi:hypothetical protein
MSKRVLTATAGAFHGAPPLPRVSWCDMSHQIYYEYLAEPVVLRHCGLLHPRDLPSFTKKERASTRGYARILESGKCRLRVPASRVISRDAAFQRFLVLLEVQVPT